MSRTVRRAAARGFTLIELLVVIIILAILAVVVIPNVIGRTEDARMGKAHADVAAFQNPLNLYKLDTGALPTTDEGLGALVANKSQHPKWNGPYIQNGLPKDPWGTDYFYTCPGEHGGEFDIYSAGPDRQPGTADDIGNWNAGGK